MGDGCSDSAVPEGTSQDDYTVIQEIASITGLEWAAATRLYKRHNSSLEAAIHAHFQTVDSESILPDTTESYAESTTHRNQSPLRDGNPSSAVPRLSGTTVRPAEVATGNSSLEADQLRSHHARSNSSSSSSVLLSLTSQIQLLFKYLKSVASWMSLFCLRLFTVEPRLRGLSNESDFAAALSHSLLGDSTDNGSNGQRMFTREGFSNERPALSQRGLTFAGSTIEEAMTAASRAFKPLIILIADNSVLTAPQQDNVRTLLRRVFMEHSPGSLGSRVAREACVFGFSPSQSFALKLLTHVFTPGSTNRELVHISIVVPFAFDTSLLPNMRQVIERDSRNGRSPGLSYMSGGLISGQNRGYTLSIDQQQALFQTILDVWSTIQSDSGFDSEKFRLTLLRTGVIRFFSVDLSQPSELNTYLLGELVRKFDQALTFGTTLCQLLQHQYENAAIRQVSDREILRSQEQEYQESLRLDQLKEAQKRELELAAKKEAEQRELLEQERRNAQLVEQKRRQELVREMARAVVNFKVQFILNEHYSNIVVRIPMVSFRAKFKVSKTLRFNMFVKVVSVADYLFSNEQTPSPTVIVRESNDPIGVSCRLNDEILSGTTDDDGRTSTNNSTGDECDVFSSKRPLDYISPIPANFELVHPVKSSLGKLDPDRTIEELNLMPGAVLHLVAVEI